VQRARVLRRRLRLVFVLLEHPRGLSTVRLAEKLGTSRQTVDRDLHDLRMHAGVAIDRVRKSGESWHRLAGVELPVVTSPHQRAALGLARKLLAPLSQTRVGRELERLTRASERPAGAVDARMPRSVPSSIVAELDAALERGERARIRARVASNGGRVAEYTVDPLGLRMVDGSTYFDAWVHERHAIRTFKADRVLEVTPLGQPVDPHDDLDLDALFDRSIKTWSGDPVQVRIRLSAEVAWAVAEYPLVPDQMVSREPDDSVVVTADVAGLVEASRWALSWGRHAEVLSPTALRARMQSELEEALGRYRGRSNMLSGDER
jgi:predicted DNA-binding transcriptional regulator YafY